MSEEDLKSKARKTWGRTRSLGDDAGVERGPFLNRNLQRVVTQLALNPKHTRRTGGYLPPYLKNPPKTNASTEETGMNKIYERIAELILVEAKKKKITTQEKHPRTGNPIKVITDPNYPKGHALHRRTFGRHEDRDDYTGEDPVVGV